MTIQILGAGVATSVIPTLGDACVALTGAVGVTLPEITANATVMADIGVNIGVELPAAEAQVLLNAAAQLALQLPSISADVSAGIAGSFNLTISKLNAFADFAAYLNGLRGSINATAYTGTISGFQSEASQMVSGAPNDNCFAVTLSASTNESIASLKAIFRLL